MEGGNLWLDIRTLGATLAGPRDALTHLGLTPRWVTAFVLVALSARFLDVLAAPYADHIKETPSFGAAPDVLTGSALSMLSRLVSAETLVRALVLFAGLTAIAVCAFLFGVLFEAPALRFLPLFAVTVHSEAILVTREMVNLLLLSLQGPEVLREWTDLLAVPGLDVLARGARVHAGIMFFLNGFNPFSIWYVATFSLGVHLVTGIAKGKALFIASCLLLLRAGVPALVFIGLT